MPIGSQILPSQIDIFQDDGAILKTPGQEYLDMMGDLAS